MCGRLHRLRLTENIHLIRENNINVYLIVSQGEMALIDSGVARMGLKILDYSKGIEGCLKYVIITHGHQDHVGSNNFLRSQTGAKIAAHLFDVAWVMDLGLQFKETLCRYEEPTEERWKAFLDNVDSPTNVDLILKDGDRIKVGDLDLLIVHAPGHTPGNICVYESRSKALFTGDTLQGSRDFVKAGWFGIIMDAADYLKTLHKLLKLDVKLLLPAHYSIAKEEAGMEILNCIETFSRFEQYVLEGLKERGRLTLREMRDELVRRTGLKGGDEFELTTAYAYLDKLRKDGKIFHEEIWGLK